MLSQLSSLARSSILALAALASVPAAAPAAPLGPTFIPAVADSATVKPTLVAMGEGRDKSNPAYQVWRKNRVYDGRGRNWNNGRHYRNNGGNYRGRYYGNNGGNYRHYGGYRRHWRGHGWDNGGAFALGLGFGVPLGYYGGYYGGGYYDEPVYRPRVYRGGGGAHVQWCYDRYRSYRAWDNTFQPYHGPRQQCYSPYR